MTPPGLTPDDRDLIRSALGKVNKRIVLNILQKIESGGIPTPREMEILQASTSEAPAAPPAGSASAPDLKLEPPDTPGGQAGVAALYGAGLRTVKRWVDYGRQAKDPPPLHSPLEMPAWWERLRAKGIVKQQCGERFDAGIAKATAAPAPPAASASAEAETLPDIASLKINFDDFDPTSIDFDDGVAAARMNFKVQVALMVEAFKNPDEAKRRTARAAFKEALDMLREVERDREKIMAASGRLMKREVIRREMMNLHSSIASRFKAKLKESLTDMPTAIQSRETWAIFCDRLVDEICRGLVETKFADSLEKAA